MYVRLVYVARSLQPAGVLVMLCLFMVACSLQGGSSSASPAPAASPASLSPASAATTATPATPLTKQQLVFTGPAAGALTEAATDCDVYAGQAQLNFALTGKLGGQDLLLNIQINGYRGSNTYPVGSLLDGAGNIRLQAGSFVGSSTSGAGTVTIDAGGKTGAVDSDVGGGEHVKGTFGCDQVRNQ